MAFTPLHATISQFTHRIVGHWGSSPLLGTAKAMWLCPRVEFKSSAFTIEATRWLIIVGGLLLIAKDGVFFVVFWHTSLHVSDLSSAVEKNSHAVPVMVGIPSGKLT